MNSARLLRAVAALLFATLAVAAAYRIGNMALAENFARLDPATALRHMPEHPVALRARVEQLRGARPGKSAGIERLLRKSLQHDPVDGRSFGLLGLEAAEQGRDAESKRLLGIGTRRAPRDFELRRAAMQESLRRNELAEATRHVVAMLQVEPERAHHVVEWLWFIYIASPAGRDAITRRALEPSQWRDAFLRHATTHSRDPAEVLRLVREMQRRGVPATPAERDRIHLALLNRRAWATAFAFWIQSPELKGVRKFPNVFNGDFERGFAVQHGFDWQHLEPSGAWVGIEEEANGNHSLRADFFGSATADVLARHVLLLGPGEYVLRARIRSELLESERGPVLALSCLGPRQQRPLASLNLNPGDHGTASWRSVTTTGSVPTLDCSAQHLELRLELLPGVRGSARGSLWLDDVSVVRR